MTPDNKPITVNGRASNWIKIEIPEPDSRDSKRGKFLWLYDMRPVGDLFSVVCSCRVEPLSLLKVSLVPRIHLALFPQNSLDFL